MTRAAVLVVLRVLAESAASGAAEGLTLALLCRKTGLKSQEILTILDHLMVMGLLCVHWPHMARVARYQISRNGEEILTLIEEETNTDDHPPAHDR